MNDDVIIAHTFHSRSCDDPYHSQTRRVGSRVHPYRGQKYHGIYRGGDEATEGEVRQEFSRRGGMRASLPLSGT